MSKLRGIVPVPRRARNVKTFVPAQIEFAYDGDSAEDTAVSFAEAQTVLFAEDDDNDAFFLERAFKQANIANPLHRAVDGEEAIAYLAGEGKYADREKYPLPCLTMLDLKMPRKNGFDVLQWLRAQPGLKRMPVVVLTSSKEDPDINRAYDLGANTYVVKPVQFDGLAEMIKALAFYWLILAEKPSCAP